MSSSRHLSSEHTNSGAFGEHGSRPFAASEPPPSTGHRQQQPQPLQPPSRSMTSSRHSSIRESTVSFLRNMFAHRQADYHGDTPADGGPINRSQVNAMASQQQQQQQQQLQRSSRLHWAGDRPSNSLSMSIESSQHTPSLWRRLRHAPERRRLELQLLNHPVYKFLLICFAIILLFGAEFRDLFLPREADGAMDAIFAVVFVLLLVDLGLRIDAEDHYFSCHAWSCWSGRGSRSNNNNNKRTGHGGVNNNGCLRVGSFLFWCDLCSTMTLLADMTWVNKDGFAEIHYHIELDEFGIPVRVFCGNMFFDVTYMCVYISL